MAPKQKPAYKEVRKNGRLVLINTATGKEVKPGERLGNELNRFGQYITDNWTYTDKVDSKTGQQLTPKQVRERQGTASRDSAQPPKVTSPYKDGQIVEKEGNKFRYNAKTKQLILVSKPAPQPPGSNNNTTPRNPSPTGSKPKPKPDSKPAPKTSETYRDNKGLYQGTKEYRDKVGGSGNPLLNRFRRDMGRDATTGERQYNTPEDKSKYVDKNGKLKINSKPASSSPPTKPTTDVSDRQKKPHPNAVWREDLKRWVVNK